MSRYQVSYPRRQPALVVEHMGGGKLGNCYSGARDIVRSFMPLTDRQLRQLQGMGVISSGQDLWIAKAYEDVEEVAPVGYDDATGRVLDTVPLAPDGQAYAPVKFPVYVYEVETRCDSGD